MRQNSFMAGAVILMTANAISKILGAVFKIPLTYILHEEGMAVYNTAFGVYIVFLSFIVSGFPVAISRAVAGYSTKGEYAAERRTVRLMLVILSLLGAAGSVALYLSAPYFAAAMKEPNAAYAIRVISPSVFFVALGAVYKSYFQGKANMLPAAVSQVLESAVKLAAGYGLALYFKDCVSAVTAAGAAGGVTIGETAATAILGAAYAMRKKEKVTPAKKSGGGMREIAADIFSAALPLMLTAVVSDALGIAETAVVRNRLLLSGITEDEARFLYGAYTGYALTVFHLPSGILATIGVSILPVISGAAAVNDMRRAGNVAGDALRLTFMLSLPCAAVMLMLPDEILTALFKTASAAGMLKASAPCIIPVCVVQLINAVMYSMGKIGEPFFIMLVGSGIRIALSFILTAMPDVNIYGTIYAAGVSSTVQLILSIAVLKRHLKLKLKISDTIVKPAFAAVFMMMIIKDALPTAERLLNGGFIPLAAVCAAGSTGYLLVLFFSDALSIGKIKNMLGIGAR